MKHTPVLLKQVINALDIKSGGLYIDATVGQGGHLREIANLGGTVLGIDRDINQIEKLRKEFKDQPKIRLVHGNFAEIEQIGKTNGFCPADGILFDLGLSMRQIENSGKGFSYKNKQDPLDMRLNEVSEMSAADLINSLEEEKLYDKLAKYSEDINSKAIVKTIIQERKKNEIKTVGDLVRIIDTVVVDQKEKSYARIFQALRIMVNDEINNLKMGLGGALRIIKDGGKVVVLTFHSVEDRIVKKFIRKNNLEIIKTDIRKSEKMPFERSAILRVFSKL